MNNNNKKIILATSLLLGMSVSNISVKSMADLIKNNQNIEKSIIGERENKLSYDKQNPFDIKKDFERKINNSKDDIKVNKNIVRGSVLEISLGDGQYVQNLSGNPNGYETVKVNTTGSKKLVKQDYDNLRLSGIPKVDLSNATSDSIPAGAFTNATHLTEFKFPQGITSISQDAKYNTGSFSECKNLTGDLVIPDSVTSIGNYAFSGCTGLNGNLVIPNSVTTIGANAFYWCYELTGSLIIPNSVTSIGAGAFNSCDGFTGTLTLGNNVTSIGGGAFGYTGFTGDLVIPDSVTTIGNYAFEGSSGLTGYYIVPEHITSINNAFKYTNVKVIIKVNESDKNSNYKETLIKSSNVENTYIDINSDLIIGTWIETSKYKLTAHMNATYGVFKNNEGIVSYLQIDAPYSEENIRITRNGQLYSLPELNNGKYIFEEEGNYTIKVINDWGTVINISFKNNPLIKAPEIQYIDDMINIKDNGRVGEVENIVTETFDDISDISDSKIPFFKYQESGWHIENGILKSDIIYNDMAIVGGGFGIDPEFEGTLRIRLKCTADTSIAPGSNAVLFQISENGETTGSLVDDGGYLAGFFSEYQTLEFPIRPVPTEIIMLMLDLTGTYYGESGQFMIDFIEVCTDGIGYVPSETIEYRLNNGEWTTYTGDINLDGYDGSIVKIDARARRGNYTSAITSKIITVRLSVEDCIKLVEKAELSRNIDDISDARTLVNQLVESIEKDQLHDRLNSILPNISKLTPNNITSNTDIYIKPKNVLSMSIDTNIIIFEDFDGVNDMEKSNSINLTIQSSLPYEIKASLVNEIKGVNTGSILDKNILNIKMNNQENYKTFNSITTPIVLAEEGSSGKTNSHGVDLMLKANIPYQIDIYKATIKFEVEQK